MKKLLPCPFCGGEAGIERTGTPRQSCIVACVNCGARHESGDEAQFSGASWNRRTQPAPAITSESGKPASQGASAITSAGALHQALTDPENQPNQYGVKFLMNGPKFAFKVGSQQFTLDYEPTEPGEFEFMRDMLIHAFSVFTPDVKTLPATNES